MVQILRRVRAGFVSILVLAAAPAADGPRFYPDDPISRVPKPAPVKQVATYEPDDLFDFGYQSVRPKSTAPSPAKGVNTLGEVPDSAWYTNRHATRRMSLEDLRRGPCVEPPPQAPFVVVGAKTDGITPGFRMTDARGRLFFVKPDPRSNPEMATAADAIGSRFFYALGYNTPENFIVNLRAEDLSVSPKAKVTGISGKPRLMTRHDVDLVLLRVPRRPDGSLRIVASLAVEGSPVGPFRYDARRSDDPNDLVPHQDRRDLRGLRVFAAWLNHTDAKGHNSLDAIVERDGIRFVRHYLIDFGSILGSDSDMPKDARFGHEYIVPNTSQLFSHMGRLGLAPDPWESAKYPHDNAVGRFESAIFNPLEWKPNYPNPAFDRMLPDDAYWAAKIVMTFTDDDIRAIVEAGEYSSRESVDYIVKTLAVRRDKIGRAYFEQVLPLDNFRFENGALRFDDLPEKYHFAPSRQFDISWFDFDNQANALAPAASLDAIRTPFGAARIMEKGKPAKLVTVFFRRSNTPYAVVGIERTW